MNLALSIVYFCVFVVQVIGSFYLCTKGKRCRKKYFFIGCMLLSAIWCFSQICIYISCNITQMWISYSVGNGAICFIGSFWLLFCLMCLEEKIYKRYALLIAISLFLYITVLSNPFHHLYYKKFVFEKYQYGIAFGFNVLYNYICILLGVLILYIRTKREKKHKKENGMLVISAMLPLLFNCVYQLHIFEVSFDLTPLSFGLSYLLVLIATFRYDFLNVNQLAFEKILQESQEGIALFQLDGKSSFINKELCQMFEIQQINRIEDFYAKLKKDEIEELNENCEATIQRKENYFHIQKDEYYVKKRKIAVRYHVKDVSKYYKLIEQSEKIAVLEQNLALERERKKMLQQVHDTTGHTLTMIQSLLKLADVALKKEEKKEVIEQYILQADDFVKQGIRELREYITSQRGEGTKGLLTERLRVLANSVKELSVEVTVLGEENASYASLAEVAFVSIKECITNTLKYAKASKFQIVLKYSEDCFEIHFYDDGKGCEKIVYGMGLEGIERRIKAKQGTFKVSSEIGEGFWGIIKLPLQP